MNIDFLKYTGTVLNVFQTKTHFHPAVGLELDSLRLPTAAFINMYYYLVVPTPQTEVHMVRMDQLFLTALLF